MELTLQVLAILTPQEMRRLRKHMAVLTLSALSVRSGISVSQLSQFENEKNGLTEKQVRRCEEILIEAARDRSQALSRLLSPDENVAVAS